MKTGILIVLLPFIILSMTPSCRGQGPEGSGGGPGEGGRDIPPSGAFGRPELGAEGGLIVLLTDFGDKGFLLGSMKGVIYSINRGARLEFMTTSVQDFDIEEGAWILSLTAGSYPPGTIFLTIVDPGVGGEREPVMALSREGHIFVAPNNGILTGILHAGEIERAFKVIPERIEKPAVTSIYRSLEIYAPVVAMLSKGSGPEELGEEIPISALMEFSMQEPASQEGYLICEIVIIDNFGNCITNLTAPIIEKAGFKRGDPLKLLIGEKGADATYVSGFDDIKMGKTGLLPSIKGFLQIAINQGDAASTYRARRGERVVVMPGSEMPEEEIGDF